MCRNLTVMAIAFYLLGGIYMMAGDNNKQSPPINLSIASVDMAKKAPANTHVVLIGKLITADKKFALLDSTGKIILALPRDKPGMINSNLGQSVKITGTTKNSFWSKIGLEGLVLKVENIELLSNINSASNTATKK